MSYTIVGVIGHIDHGKTSLVAALTGIDTDTHPEEKRRGITIDLGFASYTDGNHRFALIDAPGHQKYIGNLLAGVSAVDIGLLVVASDQGIQAQTLEHAAILQSLGVPELIVAISRIDLVDEATLGELSEELDVFLADFGFHEIPKVPLSTVTGVGLDELKRLMRDSARSSDRQANSQFRMPIDRVFTIEGRGSVVAGTPWSGSVTVGDHLQVVRTGRLVRVRELEVHDLAVTQSRTGQRTAMNLTGVSSGDIVRGDELVTEGTHVPSSRLVVQLTMFRDAGEIRPPTTVQLHTATSSCAARLSGMGRIGSGEKSIVVVDTGQPVVATYLQQCLFRRPYPVGSMAGGRVLACVEPHARQTTRLLELGAKLASADARERLAAWVDFRGELDVNVNWFELQLGVPRDDIRDTINACIDGRLFQMPLKDRLVSTRIIDRIGQFVLTLLTARAEKTENAWLAEEAVVNRARSTGSPELIRWVIDTLVQEKSLVRVNQMIAVASEQTVLSKKQRARMDQILAMFVATKTPPTLKEVAQKLEMTSDAVSSLIRFATGQGILIDLGQGFFISHDAFRVLCSQLRELFDESSQQSVSGIRDQWQMTRKHTIPLLEYCDQIAVTVRQGDTRTAGPELDRLLSLANDRKGDA